MKLSTTVLFASLCGIGLVASAQTKPAPSTATPTVPTAANEGWKWGKPDAKPVAELSPTGVLKLQNSISLNPSETTIQLGTLGMYPATDISHRGIVVRADNNPYSKRAIMTNDGLTFTQNAPARLFYHTTELGHGSLSLKFVKNESTNEHSIFAVAKGDLLTTGKIGIGAPAKNALYVGGDFVVKAGNDTASAPDFYINDKGFISIGTDKVYQLKSEQFKVSVNGKIACKELKVDAKWADFVFADNYSLRSLSEVEQYIAANKHLPDVPSASTVENEGLAVGEMQAIMMQKIEELTLYMIKLEKDNNALKAEIANLKK